MGKVKKFTVGLGVVVVTLALTAGVAFADYCPTGKHPEYKSSTWTCNVDGYTYKSSKSLTAACVQGKDQQKRKANLVGKDYIHWGSISGAWETSRRNCNLMDTDLKRSCPAEGLFLYTIYRKVYRVTGFDSSGNPKWGWVTKSSKAVSFVVPGARIDQYKCVDGYVG